MGVMVSEKTLCNLLIHGGTKIDIEEIEEALTQFNLIAFVLHEPNIHLDFDEYLGNNFTSLSNRSDQYLLFFSLVEIRIRGIELDLLEKRDFYQKIRAWEKRVLEEKKGTIPQLTVDMVAQKLEIPYESLPCLVVLNDIKAEKYRWYTTSYSTIDRQLVHLGGIARDDLRRKDEWGFAAMF